MSGPYLPKSMRPHCRENHIHTVHCPTSPLKFDQLVQQFKYEDEHKCKDCGVIQPTSYLVRCKSCEGKQEYIMKHLDISCPYSCSDYRGLDRLYNHVKNCNA